MLNLIWRNYAFKRPNLWRQYVLRQQDGGEKIMQILFKAAYKLVKEGSNPCLNLLAYVFVSNSNSGLNQNFLQHHEKKQLLIKNQRVCLVL